MDLPTLGRRRLLQLGAGGVTAALLAACAPVSAGPEGSAAEVRSGSFTSKFRPDTDTNWSVAVPDRGSSGDQGPSPLPSSCTGQALTIVWFLTISERTGSWHST